jgi:hypothetical protein
MLNPICLIAGLQGVLYIYPNEVSRLNIIYRYFGLYS